MGDPAAELSPGARIGLGSLMVIFGLLPMAAAFDIGPLGPGDINGPLWLGFVAGAIFFLGGLLVAAGPRFRNPQLSFVILFALIAGFAAIGNWVAFGAGTRACSVPVGGIVAASLVWSELACRGAFGIGAVVLNGFLVMMLAQGLVRVAGPGSFASGVEEAGKWVMFVTLAPILIPLLLFTLLKVLFDSVLEYSRTGRWPRNEAFIERMKLQKQRVDAARLPGRGKSSMMKS